MFHHRLLAVLLLLVCLLNGAPFLLGRVGLLYSTHYQADRERFCPSSGPPSGLVSACPPLLPSDTSEHNDGFERLNMERLHSPLGYWGLLKAPRLVLLLGFPVLILWAMLQGHISWPVWRTMLPALPLLVSSAIALLHALLQAPLIAAFSAMRSMAWLPLLVLSGPVSQPPALVQLARVMALLIVLQIPLMVVEAIWGLPMSFGPSAAQLAQASMGLPTRLVGSFILPNSLGVAMVCLLGFCMAYLPKRRPLIPLATAVLLILILARSGTGLLTWTVLMAFWSRSFWGAYRALSATCLMLLAAISLVLPFLLGRPDLWQSLNGRIEALTESMGNSGLFEWLFGTSLFYTKPTESLPEWLLLQGGLVALVAFYGLMVWIWQHDNQARPFLLSIVLSSFTLTIVELFPLNYLLAFSANRCMMNISLSQKSL